MTIKEATTTREKPARLKMSYEEYLDWSDEDTFAEWVDGEVIVFMPVKRIHQDIVDFLAALLINFVQLLKLGHIATAPIEMKVTPGGSSRKPDILFIAQENLERLTEDRLAGPADLIVEVISEDSVRRDRSDKFKEYQEAGVREYWIIDPRPGKQRADFYRLNDAGEYELVGTEDDDRVESAVVPGFWLRPAWLWRAHDLSPIELLLEIRGVSEEQQEAIKRILRGDQ